MSSYTAWLRDNGRLAPCPRCGTNRDVRGIVLAPGDEHYGVHYGVQACEACDDAWIAWGAKWQEKPKKRGRDTHLLHEIRAARDGEPLYCELCLRDERFLPEAVRLEAHHVVEHQDGGTNHHTNLWVLCNECHQLVHWRRKTVNAEQAGKVAEHAPG